MINQNFPSVQRITGLRSFVGKLSVPGDKSISHRALFIAALASGISTIRGISRGQDVMATMRVIDELGATVVDSPSEIRVTGGIERLGEPASTLDVGNSGTLIRLGAGFVAGIGGRYSFSGDESVNRRPMKRIFDPLTQMGAKIEAATDGHTAPFTITCEQLDGIRYELPVASAQVKSSILFAGLGARGITTVVEKVSTRAHSEEMLLAAGANLEIKRLRGMKEIRISKSKLSPGEFDIPGDPSQAAFWIVAALITPNSQVTVRNVYVGELRAEFLPALRRMGADIDVLYKNEQTADIVARSSELIATEISGSEIPGLIDEIPILCVAASHAVGTTVIKNAEELRVKESDRISVMADALRSFGVEVREFSDGMGITGSRNLHPGNVSAYLDHRIAMACAILATSVDGESEILGFDSVESSYPSFLSDLEALSASKE